MNASRSGPTAAEHTGSTIRRDGVVVVGGGYAGLHAARAVADADVPVAIVDPSDAHDHVTRLAAVAGGTTPASRAQTPFEAFGHETIAGRATSLGDGRVVLDDGRTVTAEAVVVAAGAAPTEPPIDGIEHAATLRSSADALFVRNRLEDAERLVVIGGGATGVQLAGCAAAARDGLEVVLIEAGSRLLGPMSRAIGDGARRILEGRGVDVRLDAAVDTIEAGGVIVDGELVRGLPVWAGGFRARADGLGVDVSGDGRILVDDHLRVMGLERTFAAGDIAAHLDDAGSFLPLSAQIAVQAGTAAGSNAAATVRGDEPERPTLAQRGWVLDLGGGRGLAEFGPIHLTGVFADLVPPLLHDAIDVKTVVGERGITALPSALFELVTA